MEVAAQCWSATVRSLGWVLVALVLVAKTSCSQQLHAYFFCCFY